MNHFVLSLYFTQNLLCVKKVLIKKRFNCDINMFYKYKLKYNKRQIFIGLRLTLFRNCVTLSLK
jgi:hypothetical protein